MKIFTGRHVLSTAIASLFALGVVGCDRKNVESTNVPKSQVVSTANTSISTNASDTELAAKVKTALTNDQSLRTANITVIVKNREVSLSGDVDNQSQHEQTLKVTRSIDGVSTIDDKLSIKEKN